MIPPTLIQKHTAALYLWLGHKTTLIIYFVILKWRDRLLQKHLNRQHASGCFHQDLMVSNPRYRKRQDRIEILNKLLRELKEELRGNK